MKYDINILKGIHPGIIIERDLRRLNLSQKDLARKIGEYPSRITEIIKGRRKLNVPLSLKLEQEMGYETGFYCLTNSCPFPFGTGGKAARCFVSFS